MKDELERKNGVPWVFGRGLPLEEKAKSSQDCYKKTGSPLLLGGDRPF